MITIDPFDEGIFKARQSIYEYTIYLRQKIEHEGIALSVEAEELLIRFEALQDAMNQAELTAALKAVEEAAKRCEDSFDEAIATLQSDDGHSRI